MSEVTAADVEALKTQVSALEADHAALKKQVADLQTAATGDDALSHEDLVALITSINVELGNAPAGSGSQDGAASGTGEPVEATA